MSYEKSQPRPSAVSGPICERYRRAHTKSSPRPRIVMSTAACTTSPENSCTPPCHVRELHGSCALGPPSSVHHPRSTVRRHPYQTPTRLPGAGTFPRMVAESPSGAPISHLPARTILPVRVATDPPCNRSSAHPVASLRTQPPSSLPASV